LNIQILQGSVTTVVSFITAVSGRVDIQDTVYINTGISQSEHQGTHSTQSVRLLAILFCDVPFMDWHRQTIL